MRAGRRPLGAVGRPGPRGGAARPGRPPAAPIGAGDAGLRQRRHAHPGGARGRRPGLDRPRLLPPGQAPGPRPQGGRGLRRRVARRRPWSTWAPSSRSTSATTAGPGSWCSRGSPRRPCSTRRASPRRLAARRAGARRSTSTPRAGRIREARSQPDGVRPGPRPPRPRPGPGPVLRRRGPAVAAARLLAVRVAEPTAPSRTRSPAARRSAPRPRRASRRGPGGNGYAAFPPGDPGQFLDTDRLWELPASRGTPSSSGSSRRGSPTPRSSASTRRGSLNPPDQGDRFVHTFFVEAHGRTSASPSTSRPRSGSCTAGRSTPRSATTSSRRASTSPAAGTTSSPRRTAAGWSSTSTGPARPLQPLESVHPTLRCHLIVGRRTPESDNPKDSRSFVGRLDELAIYDHPLSAEEVRAHYRLGSESPRPD